MNRGTVHALAALLWLVLLLLSRSSFAQSPPACVPGAQVACTCIDARPGSQVCAPDGRSFEACRCAGPGAPVGPAVPPVLVGAGTLSITSEESGIVRLDGSVVGRAPIVLPGVAPGDHELSVEFDAGGDRKQRVLVFAGQTTQVHVTASRARSTAAYRKGVKLGVGLGGDFAWAEAVHAGEFAVADFVLNIGAVPAIDVRSGLRFMAGRFDKSTGESALFFGIPAHVHFNLGSVYSIVVGGTGGLLVEPALPHTGGFAGGDLSVLSFRLGSRRQIELTLMQHFWLPLGDALVKAGLGYTTSAWIFHNSATVTYLFL